MIGHIVPKTRQLKLVIYIQLFYWARPLSFRGIFR